MCLSEGCIRPWDIITDIRQRMESNQLPVEHCSRTDTIFIQWIISWRRNVSIKVIAFDVEREVIFMLTVVPQATIQGWYPMLDFIHSLRKLSKEDLKLKIFRTNLDTGKIIYGVQATGVFWINLSRVYDIAFREGDILAETRRRAISEATDPKESEVYQFNLLEDLSREEIARQSSSTPREQSSSMQSRHPGRREEIVKQNSSSDDDKSENGNSAFLDKASSYLRPVKFFR